MNKILTLGSLFDGSGTFPAAGILSGITPIWASEIEPFPIRVTTRRLPYVKHLGDLVTSTISMVQKSNPWILLLSARHAPTSRSPEKEPD